LKFLPFFPVRHKSRRDRPVRRYGRTRDSLDWACGLHGGKPLYLRAHHYSAVEVSVLAANDRTVAQTAPAYQDDLKLAWTEVAALRAGAVVARPLKLRKHCSRS